MKSGAFMGILAFGFATQMMAARPWIWFNRSETCSWLFRCMIVCNKRNNKIRHPAVQTNFFHGKFHFSSFFPCPNIFCASGDPLIQVNINTTAGPLVKSRWAEVKVLPAQLRLGVGCFCWGPISCFQWSNDRRRPLKNDQKKDVGVLIYDSWTSSLMWFPSCCLGFWVEQSENGWSFQWSA